MAKPPCLALKSFALLTVISASVFFGIMFNFAKVKFDTFFNLTEVPDGWQVGWSPSPCADAADKAAAASKGYNAFANHVFFMALAFGLVAPIGAVTFIVIRDTLGLSQNVAKSVHGVLQLAAFTFSVLGYTQMYYAHGADGCGSPQPTNQHFQSVHSYVGICVLVLFWWQLPSALVVFSNVSLLAPGTFGRKAFLKYHVFIGLFTVLGGMGTIISGILALEAKVTPGAGAESWYDSSRAAAAAFVTLFLVALTQFEAKSSPITDKAGDALQVQNPSPGNAPLLENA